MLSVAYILFYYWVRFLLPVAYVLFLLQVGGQVSLDVAASYNNIGNVYDSQGKYEEALEYYQKDLDITVRLVGGDHPDVAGSKENIGLVFKKMTKKSEARQMFTEAAGIRRKVC